MGQSRIATLRLIKISEEVGELKVLDPDDILKTCIIFFSFSKSKSANFPIALSIAQAASVFGQQDLNGRTIYWSGFANTFTDLTKAAELLRLAGNWVGARAIVNGSTITKPFNTYLTLACYLEGMQCANQPSHCHQLIEDPFHPNYDMTTQRVNIRFDIFSQFSINKTNNEPIKRYIFPCKKMLSFSPFHARFSFKKTGIIKPHDEIDAAAVEYGISVCPYFNVKDFREFSVMDITVENVNEYLLTRKND